MSAMLRLRAVLVFLLGTSHCSSQLVHSGTPTGISQATDCAIRQFAWEYGKKLQPSRGDFKSLYDALQLAACGTPTPLTQAPLSPHAPVPHTLNPLQDMHTPPTHPVPAPGTAIFIVDPTSGDDIAAVQQPGSTPYATIAAAVAASRNRSASENRSIPAHIVLREGVHHLAGTIELTARDSRLTIRNADGEAADDAQIIK